MRYVSKYARITSRPIGLRGRLILSACLLLVAIVLGSAIAQALYQANRRPIHHSDRLGRLLCGKDRHIGDVPAGRGRRGYRLICRDPRGGEVGGPNNGIAIVMALPFILLIAAPALAFAWKGDIREAKR